MVFLKIVNLEYFKLRIFKNFNYIVIMTMIIAVILSIEAVINLNDSFLTLNYYATKFQIF